MSTSDNECKRASLKEQRKTPKMEKEQAPGKECGEERKGEERGPNSEEALKLF